MLSENHVAIKVRLRANMLGQILRFLQHIAQKLARLLLLNGVECRSATPASKQAGKELAILAEPIVVINKEHPLVQANQVGCHDQAWSIRTFNTLFLEYIRDGLGRVKNDITRPKDDYGRNIS